MSATIEDGTRFDVAMAMRWESCIDYAIHTARKGHGACRDCKEDITAGQQYVRVVWYAPWTLIADDVDDEGRPTGGPAGEWGVTKEHVACVVRHMREEGY